MKLKLICCEVFLREACLILSNSPHTIDPEFTPKGSHDNPAQLRKLLQDKINSIPSSAGYDAVLLGYGICGNATAGLTAGSVPLIIPRAHDCCTILLGSRERFVECFQKNLSAEWSSAGYMERGENYLREAAVGQNNLPHACRGKPRRLELLAEVFLLVHGRAHHAGEQPAELPVGCVSQRRG